jgi:lanthanide-dependent methanol dehydrogenase
MAGKDYASTRYSDLAQITATNVGRLRPSWSFSTGVLGGHEGQPLVVNRTMYVVTPYPNVLYAFDLTHEGYPLKWKYRPDPNPAAIGIACCDAINRGPTYADGKIVYNLLDGHMSQRMRTRVKSCGKRKWPTSAMETPPRWRP